MAVSNAAPVNTRNLKDALYIVTKALPAAAGTVNSNAIDLNVASPYPITEKVIFNVVTTASAGSANSKNCNIIVQDSADNSTFANLANVANPFLRVTDSGGNTAAGAASMLLPPVTRRYVRVQAVLEANGGNVSDANVTMQLLF